MKSGSFFAEKNAFIQLTDMDLYTLLKRTDSYITNWEACIAPSLIANGKQAYEKQQQDWQSQNQGQETGLALCGRASEQTSGKPEAAHHHFRRAACGLRIQRHRSRGRPARNQEGIFKERDRPLCCSHRFRQGEHQADLSGWIPGYHPA